MFPCELCGYRALSKDGLAPHMKNAHPEAWEFKRLNNVSKILEDSSQATIPSASGKSPAVMLKRIHVHVM